MVGVIHYLCAVVLRIVLGLPVLHTASAQERLSLTVEECVEIGVKNSKALHSSFMRVRSAEAKASEARASRLPSLTFNGAYTHLSEVPPFEISLPFGSSVPGAPSAPGTFEVSPSIFNTYTFRLTLQQPLFTGFRLQSSVDIAESTTDATQKEYIKDKADLTYAIEQAYWSLFKAIEVKKFVDENVLQVQAHLKDVQNFFSQGMVTYNEVLKVQVQLSNVQLLQISVQNTVRLAMTSLNNLIGRPLDTETQPTPGVEHRQKELPELSSLIHKALENRPEVEAVERWVRAG
ncbi:MAG: TolC family protein, partial [Candidatus Latescibacteria bacterium]|nr:TolC family protein [Candidatus Latescibacterota bacterium]